MAALSESLVPRVVDLRHIRSADIEPLLAQEIRDWERMLDWDFRPSTELVRRFVDMQALAGYALVHSNRVAGYVYYVCEERKGLIGDLYVAEPYRSVENENLLLGPVLDALFAVPFVRRVESQLMMITQPLARKLPMGQRAEVFARDFMEIDLRVLPGPGRVPKGIRIEPWTEAAQDESAQVIAEAYEGHVDSRINDQYRSAGGARRFLLNIIQYPGCGSFSRGASYVAVDESTGRLCGVCLASLVREQTGHITQICVTPKVRGTGTGYALLQRSLAALAHHGCKRASLTVTSANRNAIRVYQQAGFRTSRNFAACVWEVA